MAPDQVNVPTVSTRRGLLRRASVSAAALFSAACAACSGSATTGNQAPSPPTAPAQITLAHWQAQTVARQAQDAAMARLKQRLPNITVNEEIGQFDTFFEKLLVQHTAGTPPDVTFSSTAGFALMAKNGVYLDLGKLLGADKTFKRDDYFPAGFQMFAWDSKQYALPAALNAYLFFHNRSLLEQSGAPVPRAGWAFADFQQALSRTTRLETGTWGFSGGVAQFYHFLLVTDGKLFDERMTEYLGDRSSGAARAMTFWADVWRNQRNPAGVANAGSFTAGKAAFIVNTRSYVSTLEKAGLPFQWDVAMPPKWDQSAAMYGGLAYAISSKTKYGDASWQLVRELIGEDSSKVYAQAGGDIPWLIRVARTMTAPPANHAVFLEALNALGYRFGSPPGKAFPLPPATREMQSDAVEPLVKEVLDGTKTAQQALQEMRSKAEPIMARYR